MLFKLPKKSEESESAGAGMHQPLDHKLGDSAKIESVLQQVEPNACVHWVTEGDWSMHDLLIGLLMISGPATVYLSSYAFSEYPARIINDMKDRKMITKLYCLIDSRIDKRSASALTLVQNCSDKCKMVNTHAKVTLIISDTIELAVISSANYTTNRRYETGVIIAHPGVVNFHKKWMENELDKH